MIERDAGAVYREQARIIGKRLDEEIAHARLSNRKTCKALRVHISTMTAWLNGEHKPAPNMARRIEKMFPAMAEVFALHGVGEMRLSKRRSLREQSQKSKSNRLTAAGRRRRLYLIEERHRVMLARRKRQERIVNEET